MCGLVGFFGSELLAENGRAVLQAMGNAIINRGPDDCGYWFDSEMRIGLGHRRLAIVDLSLAGHQPMNSSDDRFVIAFNGEIYNHLLLRGEMERSGLIASWRGHSDTETLLAGFVAWGVQDTIARSIGMFAFAVWDRREQRLTLGRDRLGEKPLYYGWQGSGNSAAFLFGSDLAALKKHPVFTTEIDRNSLALLMRHNYIPAPYSIYRGIRKLAPGTLLTVSKNRREPQIVQYWSVSQVAAKPASPFVGTTDQAVGELENLLMSAVGQQMAADVPLGAFLSGGIDSSSVVALMQAQSALPVKTFTIGFHEVGMTKRSMPRRWLIIWELNILNYMSLHNRHWR